MTGTGTSCHTHATCWPRWVIRPSTIAPGLPRRLVGRRRRPSPPAICWNEPKSSPAQNDAPSPESTTARSAGLGLQALAGLGQGEEHRAVEGVALLGTVEADVGHAGVDGDGHTIGHGDLSLADRVRRTTLRPA